MATVPRGFWLANLALVWAGLFTAWAMFGSAYSSGESVLAWLLVVFAVITGLTIGRFVLPAAVALVAAATLTPVSGS